MYIIKIVNVDSSLTLPLNIDLTSFDRVLSDKLVTINNDFYNWIGYYGKDNTSITDVFSNLEKPLTNKTGENSTGLTLISQEVTSSWNLKKQFGRFDTSRLE